MNKFIIITFVTCGLFFSCISDQKTGKETLYVSIAPQKFIVEAIVGDKFNIEVMVRSGFSPSTYDPTANQLYNLKNAKAYFSIGYLGFEQVWLPKLHEFNSNILIKSLSEYVVLICDLHHHEDDKYKKISVDPHIWMSTKNLKKLAQNCLNAMININPVDSSYYTSNYQNISEKIIQCEKRIAGYLSNIKHNDFLIYHPALTYFAHDYNLIQHALEHEGKYPTPSHMLEIINLAKNKNLNFVFIQKEFDIENAKTLADEIDAEIIQINPLSENILVELENIAKTISKYNR